MNRPSLLARLMGAPLVSAALCVASAGIVLSWYQESTPWWLAMIATAAAVRSLAAVGEVGRYKRWDAKWQTMGAPAQALEDAQRQQPRGPEKPKRRWKLVTLAALLLVAIPAFLAALDGGMGNDAFMAALALLWCVAGLYLALRAVRGMLRRGTKRRTTTAEIAKAEIEAAPVAWLVPRASDSPSRADAMRQLPEYRARLLGSK
jgi:hypothetical protein